jgi:hypothetical protein
VWVNDGVFVRNVEGVQNQQGRRLCRTRHDFQNIKEIESMSFAARSRSEFLR